MSERAALSCIARTAFGIAADVASTWSRKPTDVLRAYYNIGARSSLYSDSRLHCFDAPDRIKAAACASYTAIDLLNRTRKRQGSLTEVVGRALAIVDHATDVKAKDMADIRGVRRHYASRYLECGAEASAILHAYGYEIFQGMLTKRKRLEVGRQRKVES